MKNIFLLVIAGLLGAAPARSQTTSPSNISCSAILG